MIALANDEFAYTIILIKGINLIAQLSVAYIKYYSVHINSDLYMYPIILLVQLRNPYLINEDISSSFIATWTQCLLTSETGLPG